MATFIQGVTDTFPQQVDFNPDFNRIERMLRLRESMYQEGAKKFKTFYDSIFNSPMLRDQNIKDRDSYLKSIDEGLRTISGMDFSLPQNQQTATGLIAPISTDKNLIKDIVFTKSYYKESAKAEQLRTSTDPETRRQYWSLGQRALDYKAQEFKNADADAALNMEALKYVPRVNIQGIADQAFKDAGISVKEDKVSGGYIWTKKNGDAVFPISQSFVTTLFSQDPAIQEMVKTQAYVERKDFIVANKDKYGSEQDAEVFYLKNMIKNAWQSAQDDIDNDTKQVTVLKNRVDAWHEYIKSKSVIPGSDEHMKYLADLENYEMGVKSLETKKANLIEEESIKYDDINEMRSIADQLVSFSNFNVLTNRVAKNLAFKNAELTVKVDPISLATLRAELTYKTQSQLETERQANRKEMEGIKLSNQKKLLEKRKELGIYSGSGKDDINNDNNLLSEKLKELGGGEGAGMITTTTTTAASDDYWKRPDPDKDE